MTDGNIRQANSAAPEGHLTRLVAMVCLLLAAMFWIGPVVWRTDIVDDDAAQHVFWLYKYADASLFPNDITVEYFRTMAPLGYRALYALLVPHIEALLASKLISGVLFLLSGWLSWRVGVAVDAYRRGMSGLLAVLAFLLLVALTRDAGSVMPYVAFQRTFAMPLLLLCLWGLVERRYAFVGCAWIGAALFYPVLLPSLGLTAACVFLRDWIVNRKLPDMWVLNGAMGTAALMLAFFGIPEVKELGPAYTFRQAVEMPEFGPNGRLQLHAPGLIGDWVAFHMMGLGWPTRILAVMALACAASWSFGRRKIPFAAWVLLGTGAGLWFIVRIFANYLMFGLYLPNRHVHWAIAAFGIVALAIGGQAILDAVCRRTFTGARAGGVVWFHRAVAVVAPLIVICVFWPSTRAVWAQPVDRDLENVYAYLRTLPKNALVAAHPDLADFIPLRSQRSVLTSTETSMPWLIGYYAIIKPRVEASLRAAYAGSVEEMDAQLVPYGVDVFVTGPSVWKKTSYFDPYNSLLESLWNSGRQNGFALTHPREDRVLFRSGEYYVLEVKRH